MACTAQNVDLVDILNRAANLNNGMAAFPEMAYSTSIMPPMVLSAPSLPSKAVPHKAGKTSKVTAKKRTWKKPKDKPKRPLSAYNIFFKEERQRLVSTGNETNAETTHGAEKKRKHRKSHGKIGFAALAQNIAAKWKNLDEVARCPFEEKASVEKTRYKKEIDEWNRVQKVKKQQEKRQPQHVGCTPAPTPMAVAPAPATSAGGNDQATPIPSSMRNAPLDHQALSIYSSSMNFEPINLKGMPMHNHNDLFSLKNMMAATKRPSLQMGPNGTAPMMFPTSLDPIMPHPAPLNNAQEKAWCDLEGLDELDANIDSLLTESAFDVSQFPEPEPSQPQQMPLFPSDAKTQGILSSIDKLDNELDAEFVDFLSEF